jgi:hypothetical protein
LHLFSSFFLVRLHELGERIGNKGATPQE